VPNIFAFPFEKIMGNRLVMRFANLFSANFYPIRMPRVSLPVGRFSNGVYYPVLYNGYNFF
jgi:hypothetical protein